MTGLYQYKAMNERGRIRKGRLGAANVDDLEARLARMGLDLIHCKPVRPNALRLFRRHVDRRDLINFCFQLEQLTRAGVPLLQGLSDLRDSMENPTFRAVLSDIIELIEEGLSLSQALAEFPRVFDSVFVNLVRVGEQSGKLPDILRELTETLKWQDEIAARAKKVVMYPSFVGVVVTGVVFFLMIYLVPQLVAFIGSMEGELPAHTRALLATSNFLVAYWFLVLFMPPLLFAALALASRHNAAIRLRVDEAKLKAVVVGEIQKKLILARFARMFALMYGAGVPVLDILGVCARFTGNRAIELAIEDAQAHISRGKSIARAFEHTRLFPPLVLRMIVVGESTGALDHALLNISYFYDRDVEERIGRLETLIEPLLTGVLGLLLGWIMLSVLGPIYDLIGSVRT